MYDPALTSAPPMLVHEVEGPRFERAWSTQRGEEIPCPICGEGLPENAEPLQAAPAELTLSVAAAGRVG